MGGSGWVGENHKILQQILILSWSLEMWERSSQVLSLQERDVLKERANDLKWFWVWMKTVRDKHKHSLTSFKSKNLFLQKQIVMRTLRHWWRRTSPEEEGASLLRFSECECSPHKINLPWKICWLFYNKPTLCNANFQINQMSY